MNTMLDTEMQFFSPAAGANKLQVKQRHVSRGFLDFSNHSSISLMFTYCVDIISATQRFGLDMLLYRSDAGTIFCGKGYISKRTVADLFHAC